MKYINTREAFLQTINETFQNEITWGGSLLGRLVNSIIRKAKIEINHNKVKGIAQDIKSELDGLIGNGLNQEDKNIIANVTAKALLEAIYNVVISDQTDKEKIYQLLDDNKKGLITQAINFIEVLPQDTNLGNGTKEELINKLNKFKELLETLNEQVGELEEDEKLKLAEKIDEDEDKKDDDDVEETQIEEKPSGDTIDILKSIIEMNNIISNNRLASRSSEPIEVNAQEIHDTPAHTKQKSYATNIHKNLNTGTKTINEPKQKQIENLLKFSDFYNTINEFRIEGPKTKTQDTNKKDTHDDKGEYIDFEMVNDNPSGETWNKILETWKKSNISLHINTIKSLISDKETKSISALHDQIKNKYISKGNNQKLLHESIDVIPIADSITILANVFLHINEDKSLNNFNAPLSNFKTNYQKIISTDKNTKDQNNNRAVGFPLKVEKHVIKHFIKLINESEDMDEHEVEETNLDNETLEPTTDDSENKEESNTVKDNWYKVFEENEENQWKLSSEEANKAKNKLESSKFTINLVDEDNKDRIIKIANLFGKAYKLYTHSRIPSGRPDGRVSNSTFREYIHLGNGTPGSPNDPGNGPWASKRVFHTFTDYISSYIENNDYKKIFNKGAINRTDNLKKLSGNVLLEFIRDMIDETALRSYDKRRSEFLNKYFGLEGYVDKNEDTEKTPPVTSSRNPDETIEWNQLDKITEGAHLKVGSFIALNVEYKFKAKEEAELKSQHRVIVAQILKIQNDKILLKWQYNNESIPNAYAGAVLSKGNKYVKTSSSRDDIYVGLIDLNKNTETKTNATNKVENTKGIIPNYNFLMVYNDINKPDKLHYTHYIPTKKKLESDVLRAASLRNPISVLIKADKENNKTTVIGEINKINTDIIERDKTVDIDNTFDTLENYIEQQ